MKTLLKLVLVLVSGVMVLSLAGCRDYDEDISQLNGKTSSLESKVSVLETLKTWAEGQVSTLGGKDVDLQNQLNALVAALDEAEIAIAELQDGTGADPGLEARLDALIAGSTLNIAQIEAALNAIDEADYQSQINELHEALETLGATDLTEVLEQIADLQELVEAIQLPGGLMTAEEWEQWLADTYGPEIEDLWDAIEAIEPGGSTSGLATIASVNALKARVEALEEALADLVIPYIQSIVVIPTHADGSVGVTATEANGNLEFDVDFLVTPAGAASVLAADATLTGVLNQVETRALAGEADVTDAVANGDVLTVTFFLDDTQAPLLTSSEGLQLALRASGTEDGDDIVSNFATLWISETITTLPSVELDGFYQGDSNSPVDTYVDAEALMLAWDADNKIIVPHPAAIGDPVNLTLALTTDDEDLDMLTVPPTFTYAIEAQYAWNDETTAWDSMTEPTAQLNGADLTATPAATENRVILSLTISADNLEEDFVTYFTVEIPRAQIDLSGAAFETVGGIGLLPNDMGLAFQWDAESNPEATLALDFKPYLATQFPTAAGLTVSYAFDAMRDASLVPVVDLSTVNTPSVDEATGLLSRNNADWTKTSNTDYTLVVKVIIDAANAVAPVTKYFSFQMLNGNPVLPPLPPEGLTPDAVEDILASGKTGEVILSDVSGAANPGQAWNTDYTEQDLIDNGGRVFFEDSKLSAYPENNQFTFLEDLKAAYPAAEFTVGYEGSQYRFNDSGSLQDRNWEVTTGNLASISPDGTITTNGTTAQSFSSYGPLGDRLVVKVTITIVSPEEFTFADSTKEMVRYLCVELP